ATLNSIYAEELAARDRAARGIANAPTAAAREAAVMDFKVREVSVEAVRGDALRLVTHLTGKPARDVNYIIPRFVLDHLPIGLAGLFIAAIIAAAMNAVAAELNSLATASVIDFHK